MTKRGFTLVELLVVIAVVGTLSAVVLVAVNPSEMLKKSRDSRRLQTLNSLQKGLDLHVASGGSLPVCNTDATQCSSWTSWWDANMKNSYILTAPLDPLNPVGNPLQTGNCGGKPTYVDEGTDTGYCFGYFYFSNGTQYEINTFLEYQVEKMKKDGGDEPGTDSFGSVVNRNVNEVGTNLKLINYLGL